MFSDLSKSAAYISAITFITKLPSNHTLIIKFRRQHAFHSVCICLSAGSIHPAYIQLEPPNAQIFQGDRKRGKGTGVSWNNRCAQHIHTFHPHLCSNSIKRSFISLIRRLHMHTIHHIR